MAKLHHKGTCRAGAGSNPEAILATLECFIASCRRPAVLEAGEEILYLHPDSFTLEVQSGRLRLDVWDDHRSVSRRIVSIERQAPAVVDCLVQRFGGVAGKVTFIDCDRPQSAHRFLAGTRQRFGEQFRRTLFRQFPAWQIASLSSGMDLQHSLSPVFPRAMLIRGSQRIAAMACATPEDESGLLTFALIWLDHLRAHLPPGSQITLCLFVPDDTGNLTAHRLRWLRSDLLRARVFRFNADGAAGEVDPQDLGNLDTRVVSRYRPVALPPEHAELLSRLSQRTHIGCCPEVNGNVSIRWRGMEFARYQDGRFFLGLANKVELSAADVPDVESFAKQLDIHGGAVSQGSAAHQPGILPERWLEQSVRAHLPTVDPFLITEPVHGQVLTFAGGERNLVDLLAVTASGRLCILELKASEDIHLPLQALDYWIRIAWHAKRGELQHLFPAKPLSDQTPQLILLAPALSFHSTTASLLRFFSPEIQVERIGINSDWQARLRVVLRLRGADLPISHEVLDESRRSVEHKEGADNAESEANTGDG